MWEELYIWLLTRYIIDPFKNELSKQSTVPTIVSHLVVVVGLCTNDPKDFYNLEDRSVLRADQTRESIYYTLPVFLCWFRLHSRLRLYSRLLTASQSLFTAFVVTFGDAHWVEPIQPQRWAGVRACPPQRQSKARQGNRLCWYWHKCGSSTESPGLFLPTMPRKI